LSPQFFLLQELTADQQIFDDDELDKRLAKWWQQWSSTNNRSIGAQNVYVAVSSCRSSTQSPAVSFFALGMVENPRFAVGIEVISVILWKKYFRFWWPHCYFRLSVSVAFVCGHFLWLWHGRKLCLPC